MRFLASWLACTACTACMACTTSSAPAQGPRAQEAPAPVEYAVVTLALEAEEDREHAGFLEIAESVAEFHGAAVLASDGRDWAALEGSLRGLAPRYVLFVVPPEVLDVNLHRQILQLSARLDDDPFPDFSFGYFTARDAEALEALWSRTRVVHRAGLSSRVWLDTGVITNMKSTIYRTSVSPLAQSAGFEGDSIYFAVREADPDVLAFVERTLPELERAAVIEMTGNGDPQGVWLFEGQRNLDEAKHWDYERQRVGRDPEGEMPRITAARFRELELASPVVWSGTCHSAATRRVFVEGDIVSTFGRTERQTLCELEPDESLGLALLDAGAVALLAPIAANHGYSTLLETEYALTEGASLGDILRSTYCDVFLAAGGEPALDFSVDGSPHIPWHLAEHPMQGGGANRILIGDPALAPFSAVEHPTEEVEVLPLEGGGLEVRVTWQPGFHPKAWDMYGENSEFSGRICARVPLDAALVDAELSAQVLVTDGEGEELFFYLEHLATEIFAGRAYLYLQANGEREDGDLERLMRAVFSVSVR